MTWENIYKVSGSLKSLNDIYIYDMANAWIVGSGGLIVKCSIKTGTSIKNDNKNSIIPVRIELQQNFPNPFNPSTTIKYNLHRSSHVTLEIYNLSGQELETLVNEFQTVGEHQVQWQADGLPSGIYFAWFIAGAQIKTMKLVLQR